MHKHKLDVCIEGKRIRDIIIYYDLINVLILRR